MCMAEIGELENGRVGVGHFSWPVFLRMAPTLAISSSTLKGLVT